MLELKKIYYLMFQINNKYDIINIYIIWSVKKTEKNIKINDIEHIAALFGNYDENIRLLEKRYNVLITAHSDYIKIFGDDNAVDLVAEVIDVLVSLVNKGEIITKQNIEYIMNLADDGNITAANQLKNMQCIAVTTRGKPVKPKTIGQQKYVQAIKNNTITFGVGPAGTGKTYLAVAMAVAAFRSKQINRIILTRPAVEAGESLGFLPGDLQQKVDPYLRPLYDALYEMMGADMFLRCQERGDIEVAPLAYMRGRTLDDSFIILDEAQNTTCEQMKMFLTRLGNGSKIVVTGDITQIDLPSGKKSGLKEAILVLKNIEDIAIIKLSGRDVVRHKLVQAIINAYEKREERGNKNV